MPRKPRITAVPVEQPEGLMVATDLPEEKTDAEQMTEILQEVQQEPKEEQQEAVSDAPVAAKAKAKRASRAKPKEEPIKEEPLEDETLITIKVADQMEQEPKEEAKIDDKVACPDCGKQMSAKTLKYSHVANCVTKKQKQKQEEREEQQPIIQRQPMYPDVFTQGLRDQRVSRAARREAMVQKLVQQAF